jgi:ribosomal protein L10
MKGAVTELFEKPEKNDENYEKRMARWQERPHLQILLKQLVGNVGMIFSNGDLTEIKAILDKQAREAPAKPGMIAPADVTVQPGPTGLDPKQTQFFQALSRPSTSRLRSLRPRSKSQIPSRSSRKATR